MALLQLSKLTPKEILEEVKRRIIADPESYDQGNFCGSVCCIAGHIDMIVSGPEIHTSRVRARGLRYAAEDIERIAKEALRIEEETWLFGQPSPDQDEDEFCEDQSEIWPLDLSREYDNCGTSAERAAVACRAIDRFLVEQGHLVGGAV